MTPSESEESTSRRNSRLVICLTGMPGAGKSVAAEVSRDLGFEVFRMGDDVRMEAERRNIPPTDENLGKIMMQLRENGGQVAIASLCAKRIERDSKSSFILIDGIRNVNEFYEFKKLGKAILVSIHAPPSRRFAFLKSRARTDSPADMASFEARDKRELNVGIGEAIALADEVLVNSGSLQDFKNSATKLFRYLKEKESKELQTLSAA